MERSSRFAGLQSTGSIGLGSLQVGPHLVEIRLKFSKFKMAEDPKLKLSLTILTRRNLEEN